MLQRIIWAKVKPSLLLIYSLRQRVLVCSQRWQLAGSEVEVTKIMTQTPPRRVARLEINLKMKSNIVLSSEQIKKLENTAHKCPVSLSLHPDVEQVLVFEWR
jgi:uncharacterized OsmC-like protein